mmetsp:Transcript_31937/g.69821  ORF Transcript_31937/g.69821 Transcript_31937/m.69821 type:complete len:424 (-) Transcript_31937:133-1404(-)
MWCCVTGHAEEIDQVQAIIEPRAAELEFSSPKKEVRFEATAAPHSAESGNGQNQAAPDSNDEGARRRPRPKISSAALPLPNVDDTYPSTPKTPSASQAVVSVATSGITAIGYDDRTLSTKTQASAPYVVDYVRLRVADAELASFEAICMQIYAIKIKNLNFPMCLTLLRELVTMEADDEPNDDVCLARLLIARDFDAQKAARLLDSRLQLRQKISQSLGCPPVEWLRTGLALVPFEDYLGRPVLVVRACLQDAAMLPAEVFERGYRATMDAMVEHMLNRRSENSLSATNPLEQFVLVVELQGAGWRNFATEHYKIMVREGSIHYPERLAMAVLLRPNIASQAAWNLVKPLLPARTRKKVKLVPEAEVPSFMKALVSKEVLPEAYGGEAKNWLLPEQSQNLEDLCGPLAAASWRRAGYELTFAS